MAWVKLDDQFADHPKIEALSDRAFRLHVAGLCYCGRLLTDGFVAEDRVRRLLPKVTAAMIAELVDGRLWARAAGGYTILGFLDYNPSKEKVERERAEAAERKRRWQAKNAVRNASRDASRNGAPTRPDPARPEGSRAGVSEEPSAVVPPSLIEGDGFAGRVIPPEVVDRNVTSIRQAKQRLRGGAA
jgi:hypothetical protein